eukprot:5054419-Prorocentrum_lima.AAC.1
MDWRRSHPGAALTARQGSGRAAILMPPPQGHNCVDNTLSAVAIRHRLLLPDADIPLPATAARTCQKVNKLRH